MTNDHDEALRQLAMIRLTQVLNGDTELLTFYVDGVEMAAALSEEP